MFCHDQHAEQWTYKSSINQPPPGSVRADAVHTRLQSSTSETCAGRIRHPSTLFRGGAPCITENGSRASKPNRLYRGPCTKRKKCSWCGICHLIMSDAKTNSEAESRPRGERVPRNLSLSFCCVLLVCLLQIRDSCRAS